MENIKICELCGFKTENGKIMSNHKRWQHIMPKGSDRYNSTCQKIKNSCKEETITKTCICEKCGKNFTQALTETQWSKGHGIRKFCSVKCAHSRAHSTETKKKISKSLMGPDKICPFCGKSFHTKSTFCSRGCAMKNRYINVNRESFKYYQIQCAFTFALKDYPDEFDFGLIEKYGWYSPKNSNKPNLAGVSRDHMVSIKWGWENKVDPKIISHPANCKLVLQPKNASKHTDCSITYEELLERIEAWNKKYGDVADK